MLRFLRLVLLIVLGIALITMAFANRQVVTVKLLPDDMETFLGSGLRADVPLFLVIFAGIVAGLAIGFVWEWFRESKHRTVATVRKREVATLQREVGRLRERDAAPKDDVLALLEGPARAR